MRISTERWSLKNGMITLAVGNSAKYFFFQHLKIEQTNELPQSNWVMCMNLQFVTYVSHWSIDALKNKLKYYYSELLQLSKKFVKHKLTYNITCTSPIPIHFVQNVILLNVFRFGQLECFPIFTRSFPLVLYLDECVIVPINFFPKHIVFMLEKWTWRLSELELIFQYVWQNDRSVFFMRFWFNFFAYKVFRCFLIFGQAKRMFIDLR